MATLQMNILSFTWGMQANFSVFLPSLVPTKDNAKETYEEIYPRDVRFKTLWLIGSEYGDDSEFTFTGTCTDICVVSNALAIKAAFPEATVKCIADCCAPLFGLEKNQESALTVMTSCQVDVIRPTEK